MKADNSFDSLIGSCPTELRKKAIFVVDTLDLCWHAAQAIFEDKATPELALEIYGRIMYSLEHDIDSSSFDSTELEGEES